MTSRAGRGRNWTPEERELLFDRIRANLPLQVVNAEVAELQQRTGLSPRQMPASSYANVQRVYIPRIRSQADLREMSRKPPKWADLPSF